MDCSEFFMRVILFICGVICASENFKQETYFANDFL